VRAPPERWVVLGEVSGIYGVAGWIRVFSSTDPRDGILHYGTWFLNSPDGWEERCLEAGRRQGKGIVAKLSQCEDRDDARALIGRHIAVPRETLPHAGRGEFYWTDLIGLKVCTRDGEPLGIVEGLMETGSNDVLRIQGQRNHLVPFIPGDVVIDVDVDAGTMIVDWDPEF